VILKQDSKSQKDIIEKIEEIEAAFGKAKVQTNHEQWQVNTAVHFNAWADLKKEDFLPVMAAFKAFAGSFGCATCSEMYFVTPDRGRKEALRCGCGGLNLNLLQKGS